MNNNSLIFLSGFMGAGKSTLGKQLATELGYFFIDLDSYIENKNNKSIVEIFQEIGEPEFRKLETTVLEDCINGHIKTVIALGGGTPCFNNNIDLILKSGLMIYLQLDAKELYNRLEKAQFTRPLIEGKQKQELENYIADLLKNREPFYNQAQLIVNAKETTVAELKETVSKMV